MDRLLVDKTTKSNILWATDAYNNLGSEYQRNKEIQAPLITGEHSGIIKNRARKALEQQSKRTRQHAEVFTPLWVCSKMNDYADEEWFGRPEVFTEAGEPTDQVRFPKNKSWKRYVDSRRLEITCGEAPYLVSRYDVSTGESIPIERRIGILDRKLRVVGENTSTEDEWLKWALRAFQATYGYEFQGDNVLISRVNLLTTFEEYLTARWNRKPTKKEYAEVTNIIAWNLWQMDGLTATLPYCKAEDEYKQISIFDWLGMNEDVDVTGTQSRCKIMNWLGGRSIEFINLPIRGNHGMKFDFIIGNPPYQDETVGNQKAFAPPIYHLFMDAAYKISNRVELIHPARFLFNAGGTSKAWNEKMLTDPHLKVLYHEQNSSNVFPNTDIKGGVAVTYHDTKKNFGIIEIYTAFGELNSILHKVKNYADFSSFSKIIYNRGLYRFSKRIFEEYPAEMKQFTDSRIGSSSFERLPDLFTDQKPEDDYEYIQIYGLIRNSRVFRWFKKDYVKTVDNLNKYKVFVPKANGSGTLGEILSTPIIGQPAVGHTETFLSIGCFDSEDEAKACLKYVQTKFARVMLGVLKITQDNSAEKWRCVPLQNFTPLSDIDWTKSVPEIDQQLYVKYGLDESEIKFIESHVKEMK